MAWPRRGDCGPRDLAVISLLSLRSLADCRVPGALAGAIEANGISGETDYEANNKDRDVTCGHGNFFLLLVQAYAHVQ